MRLKNYHLSMALFSALMLVGCISLFSRCERIPAEPMRSERKLCLNASYEPSVIDTRRGSDSPSTTIQSMIFEGLTRFKNDHEVEPALAESIEISDDNRIFTFYLKETVWSDGSPLTAYDFERTWKQILDPAFHSPNSFLFYNIKNAREAKAGECTIDEVGIRALSPRTFQVELAAPSKSFLSQISFSAFAPMHAQYKNVDITPHDIERGEQLISNGPFILKKWDAGHQIVLVNNPHYWDYNRVQLKTIQITLFDHDITIYRMYQNGQIDLMGVPFTSIPLDQIPELQKQRKLSHRPIVATTLCCFNIYTFPFNNRNIRKAFSYAIDRDAIVKHLSHSNEIAAKGIIPPMLYNDQGASPKFFSDCNIEKAKKHLALGLEELGMTPSEFSNTVTLFYTRSDFNQRLTQVLHQMWYKALGINIKLEPVSFTTFLKKLSKREFQMCKVEWRAQYYDPISVLEIYDSKNNTMNVSGWENSQFSKLVEDLKSEKSVENTSIILNQLEEIFVDETPVSPIFHFNLTYMKQPYLHNVIISPTGLMYFHHAYIDEKKRVQLTETGS